MPGALAALTPRAGRTLRLIIGTSEHATLPPASPSPNPVLSGDGPAALEHCRVAAAALGGTAHWTMSALMILRRWPIDLIPSSLSASSSAPLPCWSSTSISVSGSIASSAKTVS